VSIIDTSAVHSSQKEATVPLSPILHLSSTSSEEASAPSQFRQRIRSSSLHVSLGDKSSSSSMQGNASINDEMIHKIHQKKKKQKPELAKQPSTPKLSSWFGKYAQNDYLKEDSTSSDVMSPSIKRKRTATQVKKEFPSSDLPKSRLDDVTGKSAATFSLQDMAAVHTLNTNSYNNDLLLDMGPSIQDKQQLQHQHQQTKKLLIDIEDEDADEDEDSQNDNEHAKLLTNRKDREEDDDDNETQPESSFFWLKSTKWREAGKKVIQAMLFLIFAAYFEMSNLILAVFAPCNQGYMSAYPWIPCQFTLTGSSSSSSSHWLGEYGWLLLSASVFLVLYLIGVPVLFASLLLYFRKAILAEAEKEEKEKNRIEDDADEETDEDSQSDTDSDDSQSNQRALIAKKKKTRKTEKDEEEEKEEKEKMKHLLHNGLGLSMKVRFN
jgi:hypothetical protein